MCVDMRLSVCDRETFCTREWSSWKAIRGWWTFQTPVLKFGKNMQGRQTVYTDICKGIVTMVDVLYTRIDLLFEDGRHSGHPF